MKGVALVVFLLGIIVGCSRVGNPTASPKFITLGTTDNTWSKCVGHAAHLCGPEKAEIRQSFTAVFATETACNGIQLKELTADENRTPVGQIPGYVTILYESPGQWFYQVTVNGKLVGATVKSEAEAALRVCQALKGTGGTI